LCSFLGYSPDHKGYQCLDLTTNRVIVSRHVVFDESSFPFQQHCPSPPPNELDFLTNEELPVAPFFSAGTPSSQPMAAAPAGLSWLAPRAPPLGFSAPLAMPSVLPAP
jgi:hypothetical protein